MLKSQFLPAVYVLPSCPAVRWRLGMERLFYSVQERLLLANICNSFIGLEEGWGHRVYSATAVFFFIASAFVSLRGCHTVLYIVYLEYFIFHLINADRSVLDLRFKLFL